MRLAAKTVSPRLLPEGLDPTTFRTLSMHFRMPAADIRSIAAADRT